MKLSRGAILAAFAIAIALAMGWCLRNGFVYDDLPAIVQNTRVTDPARWHTIPRAPYWLGTLWRPFTVAMYALQWISSQGAPWFFHMISLTIYFGVGVLLYQLMKRLGATEGLAAAATLLFLVHPLHVEVVANVVGQAELWAATAMIIATLMYLRARRDHTEKRWLVPLLAVVAIGIMSKEQGFVVPLLLGGAEWILFAGRGETLRARLRLLVPVTALAILLFVIRGILLDSNIGETPAVALRGLGFGGRFVTFLAVIPEWARLLIWPLHLQADYGPPGIPVGGPLAPRHLLGILLLATFAVLWFRWRRRDPAAAFGLWWIAVALAPVSNLVTPTGIVMAERVLFLPTAGVALVLAARLTALSSVRAFGSGVKIVALGAFGIAVLLLTVRSATRIPTWSTQERFFSDITLDAPAAYRGWKVAADYWDGVHDRSRAVADLKRSIELWPHDYEVFEQLGQIYRQDGHCDTAIPIFAAGVAADPDMSTVRARLIECLLTEHRYDEAAKEADAGVALGLNEFKPMQERVKKMRAAPAQ